MFSSHLNQTEFIADGSKRNPLILNDLTPNAFAALVLWQQEKRSNDGISTLLGSAHVIFSRFFFSYEITKTWITSIFKKIYPLI